MARSINVRLMAVLVLGVYATVSSHGQMSSNTKSAALRTSGTLSGTVVTDIVTSGGDCRHRYWLRTDSITKGGDSALIALDPETRTLAKYLNKKVKLQGIPKMCHGTEIDVLVFVISHISPED